MSKARTHDEQATAQLLDGYQSYVKVLAQAHLDRRVRGKVSASDIAQETLLEVQRCLPRFHGTTEQEESTNGRSRRRTFTVLGPQ